MRRAAVPLALAALAITVGAAYAAAGGAASPRFDEPAARLVFGQSVEGRKLTARRIGPADARRVVLVVGEVHGDEEAGRAVVRSLRRAHDAPRGTAIWTVTTVNPDGHEHDRRTNANGVDLNRNFPVGWSDAAPSGSLDYGGPKPLSEPESSAFRNLVRQLDPKVTVLYHQPWGAVLAPCKGRADLQKHYAQVAQMPLNRCRGEHLPGTMTRWENERGGTAFVVELRAGSLTNAEVTHHTAAIRAMARP